MNLVGLKPYAKFAYLHYPKVGKLILIFFSTRELNLLRSAVQTFHQFIYIIMASSRLMALKVKNIFFLLTKSHCCDLNFM